jgi:glycosyltransferase involved in cell wall biosynthesis
MRPRVSIVIPARNDAAALARTLDHLGGLEDIAASEIIVAASGDPEGAERAVAGRARLLWPAGSTHSELMNAGAAVARGDALFFLHADSFPLGTRSGASWRRSPTRPWWAARSSTSSSNRRRPCASSPGSTASAIGSPVTIMTIRGSSRASVFRDLGGYRSLRLMEDLDFTQRLKHRGRSVLVREPLRTSGRRFLARGPWRTFFFIVWLLGLHTLGFDTQRYAERWRGPVDRTPGAPWPKGERP